MPSLLFGTSVSNILALLRRRKSRAVRTTVYESQRIDSVFHTEAVENRISVDFRIIPDVTESGGYLKL